MQSGPLLRHATTLMAGLAVACTATAFAQDWYGALHGAKGWKDPANVEHTVAGSLEGFGLPWEGFDGAYQADLDYDSGWGVGAAVGRAYGDWRIEGELGYRASKIDGFQAHDLTLEFRPASIPVPSDLRELFVTNLLDALNDEDIASFTGQARLLTGALNIYYDLPVEWAVRPYFGAGVGMVRANKKKNVRLAGADVQCGPETPPGTCVLQTSVSSTEWDANWHAMAGAKWAFNDQWEAALGWRYTDLKGVSFVFTDGVDDAGNPSFLDGEPLRVSKNGMHNAELTLIRRF